MIDKMNYLVLGERKFPAVFDLNVIEMVQERYGSLDNLSDNLQQIKELKWFLSTIINEGIEKQNYEKGESQQTITEKEIGMLASLTDIAKLNDSITKVIEGGLPKGDESEKNSQTTQSKK